MVAAFPELRSFVDEAAKLALALAGKQLETLRTSLARPSRTRDLSMLRAKLSLQHQGYRLRVSSR